MKTSAYYGRARKNNDSVPNETKECLLRSLSAEVQWRDNLKASEQGASTVIDEGSMEPNIKQTVVPTISMKTPIISAKDTDIKPASAKEGYARYEAMAAEEQSSAQESASILNKKV